MSNTSIANSKAKNGLKEVNRKWREATPIKLALYLGQIVEFINSKKYNL